MNNRIAALAAWINENIMGNVWTFVASILFVVVIYLLLFIQGYQKWNITTGLFSNTLESSFELITGIGAIVAVVSLHQAHKKSHKETMALHKSHYSEIRALHMKIDALAKAKGDRLAAENGPELEKVKQ